MVCLGNICRSPMAEGILRTLAAREGMPVEVGSAGTSPYHVGEAPDPRAQATMRAHGMDIGDLRGQHLRAADFRAYDLLLAMDGSNLRDMRRLAPDAELARKARPIMDFAPGHALREVPDPYYGGDDGFEQVHGMLVEACTGLLREIAITGRK